MVGEDDSPMEYDNSQYDEVTPYTEQPYTLLPTLCTLHLTAYTLHPTPYKMHPEPRTPNPKPYAPNPLP